MSSKLPSGYKVMTYVTDAHFKPLLPAYVLVEDYSYEYYFINTTQDDCINNGWARVAIWTIEIKLVYSQTIIVQRERVKEFV